MIVSMSVTGGQAVANRMKRVGQSISRELVQATKEGTELVRQSARDRVVPARSINIQDGRQYRRLSGRSPVHARFEDGGMAGFVRVDRHQASTRSRAVLSVYSRLGRSEELVRKQGLYIDPQSWIKGPDGKFVGRRRMRYTDATNTDLRLFRFSRHPDLFHWAHQPNKGMQILRHSVRLRREAITQLTTRPALRRNEKAIVSRYRAAVVSGVSK